jgi:glycosyltransferase involved in cell wall biosynthesis
MSPSDFKEYEDFKQKYLQHCMKWKDFLFLSVSSLCLSLNFHSLALVSSSSLPEVHFIAERISYLKLPLLYRSVDAFVSASHGEGWGLPLCEGRTLIWILYLDHAFFL